jgi:hypothetical protein
LVLFLAFLSLIVVMPGRYKGSGGISSYMGDLRAG